MNDNKMIDSDSIFKAPFEIYSEEDRFYLKKTKGNEVFSLDKSLGFDCLKRQTSDYLGSNGVKAYSIVGIAEAKVNKYLIAATKTKFVGNILNSNIFKIEEFVYFPLENQTHFRYSDKEKQIHSSDQIYIRMLEDFLARNNLFYSDSMDLTNNIQKTFERLEGRRTEVPVDTVKNSSNIYLNCNKNYFWNHHLLSKLFKQRLHQESRFFFHPIINGYVMVQPVSCYKSEFSYILVSRKELRRSGMRFLVRGIDKNGNVANFAETEQILLYRKPSSDVVDVISYLQIRGSIPLFWTQMPNLQLNPTILFDNESRDNYNAFEKHTHNVSKEYGKVVYINLIDKKGDQNNIGEYLNMLHKEYKESKTKDQNSSPADLVWFDFHSECKKMRYENINLLLKRPTVSNSLKNMGYTHYSIENASKFSFSLSYEDEIPANSLFYIRPIKTQTGVFRTNCIDCLDRTNVIQTVISRINLHLILKELGVSSTDPEFNDPFQAFQHDFEETFRLLWTENGNFLSKCYSGTNALKADYTRTGKRTIKGALADGMNTMKRFYFNNFRDGHNQDSHDYFIGNLSASKVDLKDHSVFAPFILLLFVFFIALILYSSAASLSLPQNYEENFRKKVFKFILFGGIFALTARLSLKYFKKSIIDKSTTDQ